MDVDKDKDLAEKLKKEAPGIMRWMINGCLDWLNMGLCPPAQVIDATNEYLAGEDSRTQWFEELVAERTNETRDEKKYPSLSENYLFMSWKDWAQRANEPHVGRKRDMADWLHNRGYVATVNNRLLVYPKLILRPTEEEKRSNQASPGWGTAKVVPLWPPEQK